MVTKSGKTIPQLHIWLLISFLFVILSVLTSCTADSDPFNLVSEIIDNISNNANLSTPFIYDRLEQLGILGNESASSIVLINFSNISVQPNQTIQMPFRAFCNGVETPIKYYPPVSENGTLHIDEFQHQIESIIEVECQGKTEVYNYIIDIESQNNPPKIYAPEEIIRVIGEPIAFPFYIYDSDSNFVNYWIDGWKTNLSYIPTSDDVGAHKLVIHAKDEDSHVERDVTINIINNDVSNIFQLNIFKA
ncbi:MAG: hypothetical protein PWR30_104 [Candidatus Woesearchaeota archaeon]|nr:hypothetical protein [Candidatus Woesearchaeota archaeon]